MMWTLIGIWSSFLLITAFHCVRRTYVQMYIAKRRIAIDISKRRKNPPKNVWFLESVNETGVFMALNNKFSNEMFNDRIFLILPEKDYEKILT